jgi:hypothetical protein
MTKIEKNLQLNKKNIFSDKKLQFTRKDVQATEEALSPQKRTSSTSKHKISKFLSTFVGQFCPSGSGSNPDPKHGTKIEEMVIKNIRLQLP